MNAGDDVEIRRARLRALRERYQQAPAEAAVAAVEPKGKRAGETGRLPVPARRRGGAAKRQGRPAAGGLLQRVAAFLSQEGPGAKFVSGTPVREDRLEQLVQFLKRRGAAANNPQAQRARGILAYLTDGAPGERTIAGINIARAVALLERSRQQPPNGGRAPGFAGAGIIEGDVVAVEPAPLEPKAESASLTELVERARRLSEDLLEVNKQIARRLNPRIEPALPSGSAGAVSPAAAVPTQTGAGWYADFLD